MSEPTPEEIDILCKQLKAASDKGAHTVLSLMQTRQALSALQDHKNLTEMVDQLDRFWRWIERAHFDDSLPVDMCLNMLVHSPYAPWNMDREKWDTSHKEYDAEIDRVVEQSKLQKIPALGGAV